MEQRKINPCDAAFGAFIARDRNRKGLRQDEVYEKVGISQAHYSLIETGNRGVYLSLALEICKALDIDLNDFVDDQI